MADITVSADIHSFMQAADAAAARTVLSAATLGANTLTGAQTLSAAGVNSTPPLYLTGALNVGGNGTTTFPHIFHQPTGATAATGWSNGANCGTVFGANEATAFVGRFLDFRVAGTEVFSVASTGLLTSSSSVTASQLNTISGYLGFRTGQSTYLYSGAANTLQMGENLAGVSHQHFTAASRITSDGVGANLTISGGNGRGGAGGSLIFSTYDTQGAATIGVLTTRLTINTLGEIIPVLPMSSAGLSTGALWNDSGTVKVA